MRNPQCGPVKFVWVLLSDYKPVSPPNFLLSPSPSNPQNLVFIIPEEIWVCQNTQNLQFLTGMFVFVVRLSCAAWSHILKLGPLTMSRLNKFGNTAQDLSHLRSWFS